MFQSMLHPMIFAKHDADLFILQKSMKVEILGCPYFICPIATLTHVDQMKQK